MVARIADDVEDPDEFWVDKVSWSPDGSRILFTCETVCIVDIDGSSVGEAPIDLGAWSVSNVAAWSPDGSRIAVKGYSGILARNRVLMYTMAPDGTDVDVLVRSGRAVVAEHSGWQDIEVGIASCTDGFVVAEPERNPGLVKDCEALMRLRDTLAGDAILNWSPDTPIEQWEGIAIGPVAYRSSPDTLHVTGLSLPGRGLPSDINGVIPPGLSSLVNLRELDLNNNRLTGDIPSELGSLSNLITLDLGWNQLAGSIPLELGNLSNLMMLDLGWNQLTGSIPSELSSLSNLRTLHLSNNELGGSIPAELGSLWNLRELLLYDNRLTGVVPPELGKLWYLEGPVAASGNNLEECVPGSVCDPFSFAIGYDSIIGDYVGAVSASNAVSYSIASGNEDGMFAIDTDSGELTVAGALGSKTAASYSLTIEAINGDGASDTVAAVVSVVEPSCSNGVVVPLPNVNPGLVGRLRDSPGGQRCADGQ